MEIKSKRGLLNTNLSTDRADPPSSKEKKEVLYEAQMLIEEIQKQ